MGGWGWVDITLAVVLLASVLIGLVRGLVFEVLSLAGWVVAYVAAQWLAPTARIGTSRRNDEESNSTRVRGASGSSRGTALSSARVYGCAGLLKIAAVSPISTIFPRYITATRLQMCSTSRRSWAMNR